MTSIPEFRLIRAKSIDSLAALAECARAEGFRMVDRLLEEWHSGLHRYDADSEPLLLVHFGQEVVGVGGITRQNTETGRLRRVYVSPMFRRQGVGSVLVEELIRLARPHYKSIVLKTEDAPAAAFYESHGFSRFEGENPLDATQWLKLSSDLPNQSQIGSARRS